jgi:prepilin-type N-terminal cleavage/methylation domain-containing protein
MKLAMKTNRDTAFGRAFTLLELMIVMSIIAILATAGLSIGGAATRTARKAQAHNDCLL